MTACLTCLRLSAWSRVTGRCHHMNHSPGGKMAGTVPFRQGKTRRDHASGAWARRLRNRADRAR